MSKKKKGGRNKDPMFLPPPIQYRIDRGIKEGVSYSVNWKDHSGPWGLTTAIHWRPPPDPSASLAEAIIRKVTRHTSPMPLELDGHMYLVTLVDGQLVENGKGGAKFVPFRKPKKPKPSEAEPSTAKPS